MGGRTVDLVLVAIKNIVVMMVSVRREEGIVLMVVWVVEKGEWFYLVVGGG